jgi:hypothetical protein
VTIVLFATLTDSRYTFPAMKSVWCREMCRGTVISMKCYVCAKEGKESDAVAVCIACGMGTCMKHTIRKEVDVWEGSYPLPSRKLPKKMPRMLCPDCNAAYGEGK